MFMLPTTTKRVTDNTAEEVNARIRRQTDATVSWLASAGPKEIDEERNALKALRGDFREVSGPTQALEAVRR